MKAKFPSHIHALCICICTSTVIVQLCWIANWRLHWLSPDFSRAPAHYNRLYRTWLRYNSVITGAGYNRPSEISDITDALCLSLAVISNSLQKWSQIAPNLTDRASQCTNAYIWLYLIVFPSKQVSFATASASSKDCYLRQPWKKYWVTWHQKQLAVRPVRPTNTNRER